MALPGDLVLVTLSAGTVVDGSGREVSGYIEVDCESSLVYVDGDDTIVILGRAFSQRFEAGVPATIQVLATDHANFPIGRGRGAAYNVKVVADGGDVVLRKRILVRADDFPEIDLSLAIEVRTTTGEVVYIPPDTSGLAAQVAGHETRLDIIELTLIDVPTVGAVAALDDRLDIIEANYSKKMTIELTNLVAGGSIDNYAVIQAALSSITSDGGTVRIHAPGLLGVSQPLIPKSKTTIEMVGPGALTPTEDATNLFAQGQVDLEDVTFKNVRTYCAVRDDVTVPSRHRTYDGPIYESAFNFTGNLFPGNEDGPSIRNITLDHCEIRGSRGLPWFFRGVDGVTTEHCKTYLTWDAGWAYCKNIKVLFCESQFSADNGFSVSRGNDGVEYVGQRVYMCAGWAHWFAGFNGESGAQNVNASDGWSEHCGLGHIALMESPKHVKVSDFKGRYAYRGTANTADELGVGGGPTDSFGLGALISGTPINSNAPTDFAEDITLTDCVFSDCARGGVIVENAKQVNVMDITVHRPGSQYLADGVTTIASTVKTSNFGVYFRNLTQGWKIKVRNIGVTDDRVTPYANYVLTWGVAPNAADGVDHQGSWSDGRLRNAEGNDGTARHGFEIGGDAGTNRELAISTKGIPRWLIRGTTDSESGANAGTKLQILGRADDGTALSTILDALRDGTLTLGQLQKYMTLQGWLNLKSTSITPTIGTSTVVASVTASSAGCTDSGGAVNATAAATGMTNGLLCTLPWSTTLTKNPIVIAYPKTAAGIAAGIYADKNNTNTTSSQIRVASAPTASADISFNFLVYFAS